MEPQLTEDGIKVFIKIPVCVSVCACLCGQAMCVREKKDNFKLWMAAVGEVCWHKHGVDHG